MLRYELLWLGRMSDAMRTWTLSTDSSFSSSRRLSWAVRISSVEFSTDEGRSSHVDELHETIPVWSHFHPLVNCHLFTALRLS